MLPSPQQRLAALRDRLSYYKVDAFIQSTNDAHQSEYVCDRDHRLGYVSCFTGSAGTIIVTPKEALLWTDGRYFVQANKQLSNEWKLMKSGLPETPSVTSWISKNVKGIIGIDPLLTPIDFYKNLNNVIDKNNLEIISLPNNPIDDIWKNQPKLPLSQVYIHDIKYSGLSSEEKIKSLHDAMEKENKKINTLVITALDEIAWLLNLRGSDVQYNPVFISYLIITKNETILFIHPEQINNANHQNELKNHLKHVKILNYNDFLKQLSHIVHNNIDAKVWIDPTKCNYATYEAIPEKNRFEKDSPIQLPKALKNKAEIDGMKSCHLRDGVAKTKFFAWVDQIKEQNKLGEYTEWTFAEKLREFRSQEENFVDLSFETISAIGGNGAIIHYSPTKDKCAQITHDMYLLDSGGQYRDGTTDVTRTIHLGLPTPHQKECFTRVLKGVINLSSVVFPNNTKGPLLDSLARVHLWELGLDYRHGTGHGVGAFLNVHEGPQGFSSSTTRRQLLDYGIQENMVITNEPGYYEENNFGIRIENVMVCIKANTKYNYSDINYLTFETITLVPICKELIDNSLLTPLEISWINNYHQNVYNKLSPFMKHDYELNYLKKSTSPL